MDQEDPVSRVSTTKVQAQSDGLASARAMRSRSPVTGCSTDAVRQLDTPGALVRYRTFALQHPCTVWVFRVSVHSAITERRRLGHSDRRPVRDPNVDATDADDVRFACMPVGRPFLVRLLATIAWATAERLVGHAPEEPDRGDGEEAVRPGWRREAAASRLR